MLNNIDLYQLKHLQCAINNKNAKKQGVCDVFFRSCPDGGGYAIAGGIGQIISEIKNLKFNQDDINYLKSLGFASSTLEYLKNFKFTCDVWAAPEGTVIFPGEPVITVSGPFVQMQLIEAMILMLFNHQSLIATKASRIVRAAKGLPVMEFGARRAQGESASILGARAAYIAGCVGTSNIAAGEKFGIPVMGTMAHSWVQMFEDEFKAFKAFAKTYPDECVLLVDTYNVLKSGIPNAIKTFDEVLKPMGKRPAGVRIDSGDITYLSKKARKLLDDAGYEDCKICVSNSLDEYIIRDMLIQRAKIDSFGVGERLITAKSDPVFGGVYKLVEIEDDFKNMVPKIKLSENIEKITTPCFKELWRLYDNQTGKAIADVVTLHDEVINSNEPYEIFDQMSTWKRKTVTNFKAKKIRVKYLEKGKLVARIPDINETRNYCKAQIKTLWPEVKRFENPHKYYVDLSEKLWQIKQNLLKKYGK